MTQNNKKTTGNKGGRATIVTTAVIGGLTGIAVGGIAGAAMVSRNTRNKVSNAIVTAADYTTSAVDAIDAHKKDIRDAAQKVSTSTNSLNEKK